MLLCLLLTQARLSSRVHDSSGHKAIRKFNVVGVRKKKSGQRRRKNGGGKRAVPGRAIYTLPPRRGGAPTPVILPARRSAAVRMGRGGTARPPEAEWSSGVAAFLGGCYNQDIFNDPKKRHYHDLSVLYNQGLQQQQAAAAAVQRLMASRRSTGYTHIVTSAATPYNSYVRGNSTTNSMLQQRQHHQYNLQRAVSSAICINNHMITLGWYPVPIEHKKEEAKQK